MMKKRIVPIVVVLAVAAAAFYFYRSLSRKPDNRIMVSGNIELNEVNIAFKTAGKLIERTVDEGDTVKKGQMIARLDRDQLVAQRERESASLDGSESQLAQARTALQMQRETLAGDLEQRRADLSANEARLAELENGSRPQEKADAKAVVDNAQAEVDRARKDWDRAQVLYKNDDISTAQYDQYRSRWESAAAMLKSAREREGLVLAGPRKEQIQAQAAQVERARGALKTSEANTLETRRREQEITGAAGGYRPVEGQPGADRFATGRYGGLLAGGRSGAGEGCRCGRGAGAGNHRGDGGRHRPSMAAGVCERDRLREGEAGGAGEGDHGFLSRKGLRRARDVHLLRGGIHAEADSDAAGACEAGVPDQDRSGESEARVEVEYAGGCGDRAGVIVHRRDAETPRKTNMATVIEARGLTRRFGELTAVDHLDLTVAGGEIFGLVGPDGAGKTTTLRMLCALMDPSEGTARVAGHDVVRESQAVKDQIGYMAQRFGLYADLTVEENMVFYADLFGIVGEERQRLTAQLLRMTRMEPFQKRQAGRLSGGMKQKLALMCTLLHRPQILFLDEPTNGVDPVSRRDFWAILYQLLKEGITIFMTTAYLDEAERCNRVGLMHKGKLIRCETPDALKLETGAATLEGAFIQTILEAEGAARP